MTLMVSAFILNWVTGFNIIISESILIWAGFIAISLLVIVPYILKFKSKQSKDQQRREEAVRLGANKAVAQHPQIDVFTCIGCGACVAACPEEAIQMKDGKAIIDNKKCKKAGKCIEVCPVDAIAE